MMRILLPFNILIVIIFTIIHAGFGQKNCDNYLTKNCEEFGPPFKVSGQSKATLYELGQKSHFSITAFGGFEYRISVCAEKNLTGIFFRIREDNVNKTILYDSSVEEENYNEKMFYVDITKNLLIEVVVPEGDIPVEQQSYKKRFGCVGVLIEYDKRAGLGFD